MKKILLILGLSCINPTYTMVDFFSNQLIKLAYASIDAGYRPSSTCKLLPNYLFYSDNFKKETREKKINPNDNKAMYKLYQSKGLALALEEKFPQVILKTDSPTRNYLKSREYTIYYPTGSIKLGLNNLIPHIETHYAYDAQKFKEEVEQLRNTIKDATKIALDNSVLSETLELPNFEPKIKDLQSKYKIKTPFPKFKNYIYRHSENLREIGGKTVLNQVKLNHGLTTDNDIEDHRYPTLPTLDQWAPGYCRDERFDIMTSYDPGIE